MAKQQGLAVKSYLVASVSVAVNYEGKMYLSRDYYLCLGGKSVLYFVKYKIYLRNILGNVGNIFEIFLFKLSTFLKYLCKQ